MTRRTLRRTRIQASAGEVYRWHARPGAFERLQATGYRFRFPQLEGALRHLLGKTT